MNRIVLDDTVGFALSFPADDIRPLAERTLMATRLGAQPSHEPTIGRLIADTTGDFSALVRSEIELAKTELKFSVKAGGIGIAMLAVAGFLAVLAVIMVSIAIAFGLANLDGIGPALGFLIVFAVYLILAVIVALVAVRKVKQVRAPEQTIAAMKSNKQVLKRG